MSTWHGSIRDQIAGVRAEAKRHREAARRLRLTLTVCNDLVQRIRIKSSIDERLFYARQADQRARELAQQLKPTRATSAQGD